METKSKGDFRILVVDDETDIVEFLTYNFNREGYKVFACSNGIEAVELAKKCLPHLIILDVMMPGIDGVETCEQIRSIDSLKNTRIAFFTARSEDYSQIAGFKAGADDYIMKNINLKVLMNRVNALLRRFGEPGSDIIHDVSEYRILRGNIEIDREKHSVSIDGKAIMLPKKEFNLLLLLSSKPGKVFTRENILSNIWNEDVIVGGRTIDVHIRKLRLKIGPSHIVTIKGVGYKFVD